MIDKNMLEIVRSKSPINNSKDYFIFSKDYFICDSGYSSCLYRIEHNWDNIDTDTDLFEILDSFGLDQYKVLRPNSDFSFIDESLGAFELLFRFTDIPYTDCKEVTLVLCFNQYKTLFTINVWVDEAKAIPKGTNHMSQFHEFMVKVDEMLGFLEIMGYIDNRTIHYITKDTEEGST